MGRLAGLKYGHFKSLDFKTIIIKPEMFYWSFASLVHFWPTPIFNPGYAYDDMTLCALAYALQMASAKCSRSCPEL